jgi:hypothetical protein
VFYLWELLLKSDDDDDAMMVVVVMMILTVEIVEISKIISFRNIGLLLIK